LTIAGIHITTTETNPYNISKSIITKKKKHKIQMKFDSRQKKTLVESSGFKSI